MDHNKLVRMANHIANNFDTGDLAAAQAGTLDHIKRFWSPEMKTQIIDHYNAGPTGLNEIAEGAIKTLCENEQDVA